MRNTYTLLIVLAGLLPGIMSAHAQDTFSIVAVDTETGEVGSAGASCLGVDVSLISDMYPGIGAVHTQAQYASYNQDYAGTLMSNGHTAQEIIDSMMVQDATSNPQIRQYGIVTLAGSKKSAAFTGTDCLDYKGHITGPTYSIQGNILLGRQILDSMEARFLREPGTLADKLMAALQGANVAGADTRCMPYGTSSLSAFIRVARPGDDVEFLPLDLVATIPNGSVEPVDSLQRLYDSWKVGDVEEQAAADRIILEVSPNPVSGPAIIRYFVPNAGVVQLSLFDLQGRQIARPFQEQREKGMHEYQFYEKGIPAGSYYLRLSAGRYVRTTSLVITGE